MVSVRVCVCVCVCVLLEELLGSRCLMFHSVHSCVIAECALAGAPITRGDLSLEGCLLINKEKRRREKGFYMQMHPDYGRIYSVMLQFI